MISHGSFEDRYMAVDVATAVEFRGRSCSLPQDTSSQPIAQFGQRGALFVQGDSRVDHHGDVDRRVAGDVPDNVRRHSRVEEKRPSADVDADQERAVDVATAAP